MANIVVFYRLSLQTFNLMVTFHTIASMDLMFEEALEIHKTVCSLSPQCGTEFLESIPVRSESVTKTERPFLERCCGQCSCEEDCYLHGSCCLLKYDEFQQGRHYVDNTRYCTVVLSLN